MPSDTHPLFGEPVDTGGSLQVQRKGPSRPVDKKQRALNNLLARVEQLRAQCDARKRQLEEALVFFYGHVAPRLRSVVDRRTTLVRALQPCLHDRRLTAADRRILADVLARQVDMIFQHSDQRPADDIVALFEELNGLALADLEQAEADAARAEFSDFCASMGLDVDVPDLSPDMSPEDVAASAAQFAERLEQELSEAAAREQARASRRRPTAGQRREEAQQQRLEQARRNSIGVVYKRLARALHPDLETDPEARDRKTALMQQVTTACEANDLHTLLRLEAEYIHAAAGDPGTLAAETLDAYTMMLKQQVAELEAEWFELPLNPRYADVIGDSFGVPTILDGRAEAASLDGVVAQLDEALTRIRASGELAEARLAVRMEREARRPARSPRGKRRPRSR